MWMDEEEQPAEQTEQPQDAEGTMADEPAPEAPPAEAAPAESLPPPQASKSRDPNRTILFRHWSRPTRLQYRYLYDYRHNYYDDVIDYLDRKTKGISRDIPRAQTWAERMLRTYNKDLTSAANTSRSRDIELISNIRASTNVYNYHSKDFLYRKYPALAL
ncbi:hypothetical protein C0J52_08463 [Blattella germanica]|nr:hypothetical protein C0J52_08463 [Blattella germanica]